jgi:hypothetical protein
MLNETRNHAADAWAAASNDRRARMRKHDRRAAYVSLWVFALAFGWIEGSVVVYLREIFARGISSAVTTDLQVPVVSLSGYLAGVEITREACTILLLAAVAWLAGHNVAGRMGAFLLSFGIWDLTYYGVLKLVLGWPDSLSTWDVLFLIPLPWVAPVWAPVVVASVFVVAGSSLFWTSEVDRRYGWADIGVLVASAFTTVAAFLLQSRAAMERQVPERFPSWIFWAGVVLGLAWFLRVEWRAARNRETRRPWVALRVWTIVTDPSTRGVEPRRRFLR